MMREQNTGKVSTIPEDILKALSISDIPRIFDYLEKTFHISTNWRILCKNEMQLPRRGISDAEYFCKFLKEHIEPPINRLRMREDSLYSMLRYLLKDRMDELARHQNRYGGYYDRDGKFQKRR